MTLFLILAHERVEGGLLLFKHNKNILMMMMMVGAGGPQLCLRGWGRGVSATVVLGRYIIICAGCLSDLVKETSAGQSAR